MLLDGHILFPLERYPPVDQEGLTPASSPYNFVRKRAFSLMAALIYAPAGRVQHAFAFSPRQRSLSCRRPNRGNVMFPVVWIGISVMISGIGHLKINPYPILPTFNPIFVVSVEFIILRDFFFLLAPYEIRSKNGFIIHTHTHTCICTHWATADVGCIKGVPPDWSYL